MIYTGSFSINFKNDYTIYENYIIATINENEYNLSYNPSLRISSSNEYSELKSFTTGSDFKPYATTIGFYNNNNELIMVGKFAQPIPMNNETILNILIRYDM